MVLYNQQIFNTQFWSYKERKKKNDADPYPSWVEDMRDERKKRDKPGPSAAFGGKKKSRRKPRKSIRKKSNKKKSRKRKRRTRKY